MRRSATTILVTLALMAFSLPLGAQRNANRDITILASAARTVQTDSDTQRNFLSTGITLIVDITTDGGSTGITPNVLIVDSVSGTNVIIWTAAATLTAVGTTSYQIYPGVIAADFNGTEAVSIALPHTWVFRMTVADANSMTYSVSGSYTK